MNFLKELFSKKRVIDRSCKVTLSGRPPELSREAAAPAAIDPVTGQHKDYWVLCEKEIAKGFVRPVRTKYVHKKCGVETSMGLKLAETYAVDPKFYAYTFCVHCKDHYPVSEFYWSDSPKEDVGS